MKDRFIYQAILVAVLLMVMITDFNQCFVLGRDSEDSRYDKNVNLFSSKGELLQVKYAMNAGLRGTAILCSKSANGDVILCIPVDKDIQSLLDRRSIDKVSKVSDNVWFAFSGLAGDGRSLLKSAREFSSQYKLNYGSTPTVRSISRFIARVQHESTFDGSRRPFGVQVLLIGFNEGERDALQKWSVFLCEPSGESSSWKAVSIGKNSDKYNRQLANWWRPTHKPSEVLKSLMTFAGIDTDDIDNALKTSNTTTTSTTTTTDDDDDVSNGDGVEIVVDGERTIEEKNSTLISSTSTSIDDPTHSIDDPTHSIDESSSNNVDLYRFHTASSSSSSSSYNRKPTMSYFSTASKLLNSCC